MVKISVIIPVYNAEEFLESSLGSVLNQTLSEIELICVNDGSKDNSLAMLDNFAKTDARIKVIDQINEGCGAARNRALNEATGEYIYFFDPDDYILPNAFEKLYNNAVNNQSDIVLFKIAKFQDGEPIDYSKPGFNLDETFGENVDFDNFTFDYHEVKRHVLNSSFAPWTKLYKKDFMDNYDDFRFPVGLAFDDVPFHVKAMLRASRISFVPDYLYHYRLSNPNSVNNTSSNGIYIMDIIDLVEMQLKEDNFFDEFKKEFYLFKITQIFNYMLSSESEEYFQRAKSELSKVKQEFLDDLSNKDNFISQSYVTRCNLVLSSNTFREYVLGLDVIKLKQKVENLKQENKKLKNINDDLKEETNWVLNSNSWKITKPLRKLKKN
jgi:glycosyltransferase involved in cell wall biosynthesis